MRVCYRVSLPTIYLALSVLLFVCGYFGVRSASFSRQAEEASRFESEPPLIPYLIPGVLLAALRGPTVLFSTFDISERRNLVLLPTGVLWWWWIGLRFDRRTSGKAYRHPRVRAVVLAVLTVIFACAAVALSNHLWHRYWRYPHFGLFVWRAAIWTADALWLYALALFAAVSSIRFWGNPVSP